MTEREKLAYVAGMVDGDGSIQITKNAKLKNTSYYVRLVIGNSSERLMDWLSNEFGGYRQTRQKNKNTRLEHTWSIQNSKKAIAFVEKLFPFLVVKKKHAIIVLNFANREWHDSGEKYFKQLREIQIRGKGKVADEN